MTGARFQWLAAELRERIALGDYERSGALESEAALGRRYGVSRVTVRRALELLRDEGVVRARRGSGWYVVSGAAFGQSLALGSFQHARSAVLESGVELRRRVTGYEYRTVREDVARLLDIPAGAEALRVRAVRIASPAVARSQAADGAEGADGPQGADGAEAAHRPGRQPRRATAEAAAVDRDMVRAGPLDVVTEWVPLGFAAPISRAEAEEPGVWETLRQGGHTIELVRQSIAATAAAGSDARLLDVADGTPVLLVRRLAVLPDGTPLALSEHRYLGHRFRLDVEFRGWPGTAAAEPFGVTAVPP